MSMIRNLQMITSPGVGGREIDVPVLAKALNALQQPSWVMCRPDTLVHQLSMEWKLPVVPTRLQGYLDLPHLWPTARFLHQARVEIIHAHWSRDLSNLILAAGLAGGLPIVLTKHVYSTEKKHDPFHAWVYRHTDKIIAISNLVADNLVDTVRVARDKVVTIYNGIDLNDYWNPKRLGRIDLRQELGVPPGAPVAGFVGRLNRGKGPHLVVDAFARLAAEFPAWHLVLVGKAVGPDEMEFAQRLKEQIAATGLASRVHFAGFRNDMPAVMRTLDVLVCAAEFESLGMTAVEALAMERPVVGPDSGGIPEIIEPGRNGELFQSGNGDDLARKLAPLMRDASRRASMGRAGRETAKTKFNLDVMARQVLAVFTEVLDARQKKKHAARKTS